MDIDEDGGKWKGEFAREVKKLKAASAKDVKGKSNAELIAMGDLGGDGGEDGKSEKGAVVEARKEGEKAGEEEKEEEEEDGEVRYSDIISPQFGVFVVVCFLIGGELC